MNVGRALLGGAVVFGVVGVGLCLVQCSPNAELVEPAAPRGADSMRSMDAEPDVSMPSDGGFAVQDAGGATLPLAREGSAAAPSAREGSAAAPLAREDSGTAPSARAPRCGEPGQPVCAKRKLLAGWTPPRFLSGEQHLEATPEAKRAGVEGLILAKCMITEEGAVTNCAIIRGLPYMDEATIVHLQARRFTPATAQGLPVSVYYTFTLRINGNGLPSADGGSGPP
ncbi:energy transducer TonB [Pendulispora albinea]|uniref:Energy transducer TonB n=1 Tax=Pendulispora albinea TaxID=2741071 RepID=A0ABZ2M2I8_9BACT